MKVVNAQKQLAKAQAMVRALQDELAQTNRGLVALTMELEQRVDERTADLRTAHEELKKTNSELLQSTLEQEDRVTQRTAELRAANEMLQKSRIATLNMMEDAVAARGQAEQANAGLEHRVRERTAEPEAANKELEAFSYSVSHDLRAPLRAIDGYGRMLMEDGEGGLDPEGRRLLAVISSETKRMGQLVDDLLAFSRLGRQKLKSSNIDMTALAQAVFEKLAAQTPKRALQLEMKPVSPAQGDRAMIRVVLGNLLSNAVKFTKDRDPAVIEIGSRQQDGHAVYYVKDNGVGFDMKYAHKLFGVFQRLHSSEEFEGTGVGLALVQSVIQRHGGRVWAEGKVNEGATFYFSLPIMKGTP